MYQLSEKQIISWSNQKHSRESIFMPQAINQACPHCNSLVTFSFRSWHRSPQKTALAKSACPYCEETTNFYLLEHDGYEESVNAESSLWMFPKPETHSSIINLENSKNIPAPLLRTYEATVNVYNSGEWTASIVLMEQLWQGILDVIFPGQKNFSKLGQAKKASHLRDLFGSFVQLATAFKLDKNLQGCFELNQTPDKKTATLILDCLEYLLEYLFISPTKLNSLLDQIDNLPSERNTLEGSSGNDSEITTDLQPDLASRMDETET